MHQYPWQVDRKRVTLGAPMVTKHHFRMRVVHGRGGDAMAQHNTHEGEEAAPDEGTLFGVVPPQPAGSHDAASPAPSTGEAPYAMRISRLTVDKLGIKMYDRVSAVLAEVIANAYDADAENVQVSLPWGSFWLRSQGPLPWGRMRSRLRTTAMA